MSTIFRTYGASTANPVSTGSSILAAHINTDLDIIYADHNGGLTDANISASAAIAISKTALGTYTAPTSANLVAAAGNFGSSSATVVYSQIGKVLTIAFNITATTGGAFNFVNLAFTLPAGATANGTDHIGIARYFRSGVAETSYLFFVEGTIAYLFESFGGARLSANNPATGNAWVTNDRITGSCTINIT